MNYFSQAVAVLLIAGVAGCSGGGAQQGAVSHEGRDAEEVIREMAEHIQGLQSLAVDMDSTIRIQLGDAGPEIASRHAIALKRPNLLAMRLVEGDVGADVVCDGKQLLTYWPMFQKYTLRDAPEQLDRLDKPDLSQSAMMGASPAMILPLLSSRVFDSIMEDVERTEYVGIESLSGVECHRCKLHRKKVDAELWIDAGDTPWIRQLVTTISGGGGGGGGSGDFGFLRDAQIIVTLTFHDWAADAELADAMFTIQEPEGAEKVDSLKPADLLEMLLSGGESQPEFDPNAPHPLLDEEAPEFSTTLLDGAALDLADHLGQDVIILDFWATWCGPCVAALPKIVQVADQFKSRGVVFYAVNVQEDAETIGAFLKEQQLDLSVAMDPEAEVAQLYGVEGIPQTVIVGKDGVIRAVHVGASPSLEAQLTAELEKLVAGEEEPASGEP